jgi:hypothetical protein
MRCLTACAIVSGLSACAPFALSGSGGISPGTSAAKDVEASMGQPAEKLALANGDSLWFYPQNRAGRQTIAVRISRDGIVRSIEERLEPDNFSRIVAGVTTTAQAHELLGPPYRIGHLPLLQRDVWEYLFYDKMAAKQILSLQFSSDGVVREVNITRDPIDFSGTM